MANFVANIYNPDLKDAAEKIVTENYGNRDAIKKDENEFVYGRSEPKPAPKPEAALEYTKKWLSGKIIGKPIAPKGSPHTSEELEEMGYIGVYDI